MTSDRLPVRIVTMTRPTEQPAIAESIAKARQSSANLLTELKQSYNLANPVEELIVRRLLQQAVELERGLTEFAEALRSRQ